MERIDAIYARQSIDKSDSISIESQIEMCIYETKGTPYRVFSDRGFSGKNTDRPEFRQMTEAVRAGEIKRVICYKLDRCSRSILDFTTLMEFFRIHDVEFVSCTEKFDTSSPMGRAMLNICIVFAQLERETIQQRVYDAYHARCRHGFYMGGRLPFGFRLTQYQIAGKQTSCYTAEPNEAAMLCKMYELYAQKHTSLSDVSKSLIKLGMKNPRREDGLWIRSHIGRILRNPIYVKADLAVYNYFRALRIQIQNPPEDFVGIHGCYLFSDTSDSRGLLVLAPHEGLVSSDIWLACRKKSRNGYLPAASKVKHSWLSGRIRCGKCGYAMIVRHSSGGDRFHCSMHLEDGSRCQGVGSVSVEYLESAIVPTLLQQLDTLSCLCLQEDTADPVSRSCKQRIAALESERDAILEKIPMADVIVFRHLQDRLKEIESLLHHEIQSQNRLYNRNTTVENREFPAYSALWEHLALEEKMQVSHVLLEKVVAEDAKITAHWRF